MSERYRITVTIGFFVLVVVALGVIGVIAAFRPDATATIASYVGTVLGMATTAAVTFYMLGKTNEKLNETNQTLAKVETQTNGQLSRLLRENDELREKLIQQKEQP